MDLLDLSLDDPNENLALDEALLVAAEAGTGGEVLRFWENPGHAVILGSGGSVSIDVNRQGCARDRVPICRRASGGGTVVIGPGCLCFTLVLGYERSEGLHDIVKSARFALDPLVKALSTLGDVRIEGTSDVTIGGRKVSGSAQQRKRSHFLHHATVLYAFDLERVGCYLNPPERQPDYRQLRGHDEFIANAEINRNDVRSALVSAWQASGEYLDPPVAKARELIEEKYRRDDWVYRR